jgi:uncharacterized protein HemY
MTKKTNIALFILFIVLILLILFNIFILVKNINTTKKIQYYYSTIKQEEAE